MSRDADYSLVCPFLSDDPVYAAGVEFGLLYSHLCRRPRRFRDYCLLVNQDQILLLASRFGYRVRRMEPWGDQWFFVSLELLGYETASE